jgi:uncharacterized protein YdaU (DUF1376 family)
MAKDPAFLFYPNDYIGGTMGMTFEEKGAYIELLMLQFNRGHMTSHMIGQTIGQIWDKIKDKFVQDENGLWYNKRLEDEQKKREDYTKSRRNNKNGTNQHTKNKEKNLGHMTNHMIPHMENENKDINKDSNNSVCDDNFVLNSELTTKPPKKKPKNKGHGFFDSPYFDKHKFASAFSEWPKDKLAYYYQSAIDYSESKGVTYANWAAAVRTWERRDREDNTGYHKNRQTEAKPIFY